MSTTAPSRFRFDLDLGHRQERNSVITDTALATLVADARTQGRLEGFAEGERSATASAATRLSGAAMSLADHVAALSAAFDDHRKETLLEAVDLAATIGRKLARHLLASQPTAELEALLIECLASLDHVPHLVIRCAPTVADAVREMALERIASSGFAGRLVVMAEPELAPDDARIEWVDGGVVRDRAALEADIDTRIAAFLAARGGHSSGAHQ